MTNKSQLLKLNDGRVLEWFDNGIDSDRALVFHNGTTCGLEVWNVWFSEAAKRGVRAIGLNRPGVGNSTRNFGRRMLDDVSDVRELLAGAGIREFVSVGWSGGGGRALGTTQIEGCVAVHAIAGIPSQDPNDPRWMEIVPPERHAMAEASRADWNESLKLRSVNFEAERTITTEALIADFEVHLPRFKEFEADYKVFSSDFAQSIRTALVNGPEADVDDYAANIHLWGFDIEAIANPVTLWHGDLDDDVHYIFGEYNNSRIPGSKLVRLEGLGHVDIMVEAREPILTAAIGSLNG
jgi:pimeloyl-ACP methyl ester carboxylesterase